MKKILVGFIITLSILMLFSCSENISEKAKIIFGTCLEKGLDGKIPGIRKDKINERKIADETFENLFNAIKDNDKETIKAMFSKCAIEESEGIDEQIDDLFKYLDGELKSWKYSSVSMTGEVESGTYLWAKINSKYVLETEKELYIFHITIYPLYQDKPDKAGIYNICIMKNSENEEMLDDKREMIYTDEMEEHPGIWIPFLDE